MTKNDPDQGFALHPRLAADTLEMFDYGLYSLRLMNDRRFTWLVMVPRLADAVEIFDLPEAVRAQLLEEMSRLAAALKAMTGCDKINIAAFGNMVPQLHIHIVARRQDDPAWPGSAIGFAGAEPYEDSEARGIITQLRAQLRRPVQPAAAPEPLF